MCTAAQTQSHSQNQVDSYKSQMVVDFVLTQATEQGKHPFSTGKKSVPSIGYERRLRQVCNTVFTPSEGVNKCVCVIGEGWPDALLPFSGIICLKLSTLSPAK